MMDGYIIIVPCKITVMSGTIQIKGGIKWISEAYLIYSEYNKNHKSQITTEVNLLHSYTNI